MTGEAGYGVAGPSPRPLYLGSLTLDTVSPVELTDTCPDQSPFNVEISLSVDLVQPAFGISVGTSDVGFPPGALRLHATILDENTQQTHEVVGVNKLSVFGQARGSSTFVFEDLEVELWVPCGDDVLPLTARFDIERSATLGSPPFGSITIPNQVPCNGPPTDLTANVSDSDNDIDSVRWFLGDVLLEESVDRIAFTQGHTVKLRIRDERGATAIRTKTISCQ